MLWLPKTFRCGSGWWLCHPPLSGLDSQLLCLSYCTCASYCGTPRSNTSSTGCSFPEGSWVWAHFPESWSVSTSQEAKEAWGKQTNFSPVAKAMSHWAVTKSIFCSLSTVECCLVRKLTSRALEMFAQLSTVRPKNFKNCWLALVALVRVSKFRLISLPTVLLGYFFGSLNVWEKRVLENPLSSLESKVLWCCWANWRFQWQDVRLARSDL